MRKIQIISDSYPNGLQEKIDNWISDNPDFYIISVSGAETSNIFVTYILYEESFDTNILNS
jgi:hypothetical protein